MTIKTRSVCVLTHNDDDKVPSPLEVTRGKPKEKQQSQFNIAGESVSTAIFFMNSDHS